MRPLSLIAFFIVHSCLWAQYTLISSKHKNFEAFLHSPVTVVLTGNLDLDASLKLAIAAHWHQTQVIYPSTQAELDAAKFVLRYMTIEKVDDYSVRERWSGWAVQYRDPAVQTTEFDTNTLIAFVAGECHFPQAGPDFQEPSDCNYRINVIITQLNEVIDFLKTANYSGKSWTGLMRYSGAFNKTRNATLSGRKTLLVNRDIFNKRVSEEDFKKVYKHPVEIVDNEEYMRLIGEGNKDVNYLIVEFSAAVVVSVFDPELNRTLYVNMVFVPAIGDMLYTRVFNKTNLKELAKAVGK